MLRNKNKIVEGDVLSFLLDSNILPTEPISHEYSISYPIGNTDEEFYKVNDNLVIRFRLWTSYKYAVDPYILQDGEFIPSRPFCFFNTVEELDNFLKKVNK